MSTTKPPAAEKRSHKVLVGKVDGENRGANPMDPPKYIEDPYYWLRDDKRSDPEVLSHLRAENEYRQQITGHHAALAERLYLEMKDHVQESDTLAMNKCGGFYYYTRTEVGRPYCIHCRKQILEERSDLLGPEQILLDVNHLAAKLKSEGYHHCDVARVLPSPDHRLMAYVLDKNGDETYEICVWDPDTPSTEPLAVIANGDVGSKIAWGLGPQGDHGDYELYYTRQDAAHRPYQLWKYSVQKDPHHSQEDRHEFLLEEKDELFCVNLTKDSTGDLLVVSLESVETTEDRLFTCFRPGESMLPGVAPSQWFSPLPREQGLVYEIDSWIDTATPQRKRYFFALANKDLVQSNRQAAERKNFQLFVSSYGDDCCEGRIKAWKELDAFGYTDARKLDRIQCFERFLVVFGREGGVTKCWILTMTPGCLGQPTEVHEVRLGEAEELGTIHQGATDVQEFQSNAVRLKWESLRQPMMDIDYYPLTRTKTLVKETPVPGYDPSLYATARFFAPSRDGKTVIPVSLVWRRDLRDPFATPDHAQAGPMLLYGYGSYGVCIDPTFKITRIPLLDRGLMFAVAHVRGGGEMGRQWYEDEGKYLKKKNTFNDFVDVAEWMIRDKRWTTPDKLAIEGRSAGGLLIGAVLNMRPDLFRVAVAGVPFVDVMVTMSDPSIPLTVAEYEEWGNPNEERYFDYMKSYSPVDQVRQQEYPAILATAGLHDPRVAYWEPAKWVAHLREKNKGSRPIILKMDMECGHFSASDRYRYLQETASDYSFVLDQLSVC